MQPTFEEESRESKTLSEFGILILEGKSELGKQIREETIL